MEPGLGVGAEEILQDWSLKSTELPRLLAPQFRERKSEAEKQGFPTPTPEPAPGNPKKIPARATSEEGPLPSTPGGGGG